MDPAIAGLDTVLTHMRAGLRDRDLAKVPTLLCHQFLPLRYTNCFFDGGRRTEDESAVVARRPSSVETLGLFQLGCTSRGAHQASSRCSRPPLPVPRRP